MIMLASQPKYGFKQDPYGNFLLFCTTDLTPMAEGLLGKPKAAEAKVEDLECDVFIVGKDVVGAQKILILAAFLNEAGAGQFGSLRL